MTIGVSLAGCEVVFANNHKQGRRRACKPRPANSKLRLGREFLGGRIEKPKETREGKNSAGRNGGAVETLVWKEKA